MSLAQLEIGLLWLTGSIAVIFILTIGTYYWYSRKRSNNYLENDDFNLRYFIQKQSIFVAALPAMNVSCVNKILMVRGHYHHNLTHFHFSG